MKKLYKFPDSLDSGDFFYCYSPQAKVHGVFEKGEDHIKNHYVDEVNDWEYLTVITHEKYPSGTEISAECDFDKFGAPLLVISNDLWEKNGAKMFGLHYEVVAFEDGCNVWRIERDDSVKRGIKPTKLLHDNFKIENEERICLTAKFLGDRILININGHESEAICPDLPSEFHVGFTACEGINKFYSFSIN